MSTGNQELRQLGKKLQEMLKNKDGFLERIGYEQALTNHIMFLNGLKSNNKAEKTESKSSLCATIVAKEVM